MSEVNWDLAPEGATAIKVDMYKKIYWVDDKNSPWIGNEWSSCPHHPHWDVVATRPTQKTVADAVESLGKQVLSHEWDVILYDGDSYYPVSDNYAKKWEHQIICTREQFEACAAKKGEKWTHRFGEDGCYVKVSEPDLEGFIVIVTEMDGYILCQPEEIKPIKPTISEDAVSKLRAYASWTKNQEGGFVSELIEEFIATHDITD